MSATDVANLKARRTAIYAELAALGATKAGGLPNSTASGDDIDHQGYKQGLYDELAKIEDLLVKIQGPWEVRS
ncbi:MAG: hypothetical protein H8E44_37435 [Planctomycetes bacterium]|nr:hypothetical protein [Planctomycetota bacterium]